MSVLKPSTIIPVLHRWKSKKQFEPVLAYMVVFIIDRYIDQEKVFGDAYTEDMLKKEAENGNSEFFENLYESYPYQLGKEELSKDPILGAFSSLL